MKIFLSTLASIASLSAYELIHISNSVDMQSLEELSKKYKKDVVISDSRAYLVPSECLLERYFGGLSQNSVELPNSELYYSSHAVNEKIFDAKDAQEIEEEIAKQNISDTIEAKEAKEFLQDSSGRLFGGLSQGVLDLKAQKNIVKDVPKESTAQRNPECRVLDDSSGYEIRGAKNLQIYSDQKIINIKESILFK
ncbi:hypothetical protein FCU45_09055 [Sulfurimonas crateris]|uniref:Uncharacterized protein n=1 Tax=Sulfurimonas crateris TaxID=2574727 RepID=A0A4U2Z565_9BACT|nr:hypothetical protein [Sulfurimonas crateris]TKI68562.1 hypothetical protein FCU45_09055 [Sulfurimonas crateris]